jgi:hypothetical protein
MVKSGWAIFQNNVQTTMAAGEAHFQNGVVERPIGTFRKTLESLINDLGDKTVADDFQQYVTEHVLSKNKMVVMEVVTHHLNGSHVGLTTSSIRTT